MAILYRALQAQIPMDSGEPRGEEAPFFKPFEARMTILRYHSDPQPGLSENNNLIYCGTTR
jgi:hypothetical protein